jgi:flagellar hook-length control protein FliK
MSVERSVTTHSHKAAAGHGTQGAHGAKGKAPAAADGGAAGGAADFSALLQQLGAGEEDGAADALVAVGDTSAGEPAADDALLAKAQPPVDAAMLLAQSLQVQARQTTGPAGELKTADEKSELALTLPAGEAGLPARAQEPAVPAGRTLETFKPVLGEAVKEVVTKAVTARGAHRAGAADAATVPTSAPAAKVAAAMQVQPQQVLAELQRDASNPGLQQAVAVSGLGDNGLRRAERVAERSVFATAGNGDAAGAQMVTTTGRADGSSPLLDQAVVMTPEVAVAEQVSYWIARDVQNAELKVDGLGASPVEVSISLQGNEAQVAFRTDQVEARQVLEGSVSHLRELLGNEGLVLSGVSVGSSGADGSASQERQARQGGRAAAVAVPQTQATEANVRAGRASGRAVDLFV